MIACTGWTWEYVEDELDLPRLTAMSAYWREHPPVHVLLAAYVGYKPPSASTGNSVAEVDQLAQLLGAPSNG